MIYPADFPDFFTISLPKGPSGSSVGIGPAANIAYSLFVNGPDAIPVRTGNALRGIDLLLFFYSFSAPAAEEALVGYLFSTAPAGD